MPTSGIYIIENRVNKRFYIGRSVNIEKRFLRHKKELKNNTHHCIHLQRAWNKYGETNFHFKIIIKCYTVEESQLYETNFLKCFKSSLYNVSQFASGGDLISRHPERENIRKRMKESLIKRYNNLTAEQRKRIYGRQGNKNGMYGKTHSDEARLTLSKKAKSFFEVNSSYIKGKTFEQVHGKENAKRLRENLSRISKQRTGSKNPFYGKSHNSITKRKISLKNKGKKPVNCRPVIVNGQEFSSVTDASRELNVVPATIIHRIKSQNPKYSKYHYINSMEVMPND